MKCDFSRQYTYCVNHQTSLQEYALCTLHLRQIYHKRNETYFLHLEVVINPVTMENTNVNTVIQGSEKQSQIL